MALYCAERNLKRFVSIQNEVESEPCEILKERFKKNNYKRGCSLNNSETNSVAKDDTNTNVTTNQKLCQECSVDIVQIEVSVCKLICRTTSSKGDDCVDGRQNEVKSEHCKSLKGLSKKNNFKRGCSINNSKTNSVGKDKTNTKVTTNQKLCQQCSVDIAPIEVSVSELSCRTTSSKGEDCVDGRRRVNSRLMNFIEANAKMINHLTQWNTMYQKKWFDLDEEDGLYNPDLTFQFLTVPSQKQLPPFFPKDLLYFRELLYTYVELLSISKALENLTATINSLIAMLEKVVSLVVHEEDLNTFTWRPQSPLVNYQKSLRRFFDNPDKNEWPKPAKENTTDEMLEKYITNVAIMNQLMITATRLEKVASEITNRFFHSS